MIIEGQNFSRNPNPAKAEEYRNCNFSQLRPGTRLWPGDDTPRRFVECNLTNAVVPPGSTLERCNTTQVDLRVEAGTEDVTVGARTIQIKRYINRILGRLNRETLKLEPNEVEVAVDPPKGSRDLRIKRLARVRDEAWREAQDRDADLERETPEKEVER